jgi:hypothetical protein
VLEPVATGSFYEAVGVKSKSFFLFSFLSARTAHVCLACRLSVFFAFALKILVVQWPYRRVAKLAASLGGKPARIAMAGDYLLSVSAY